MSKNRMYRYTVTYTTAMRDGTRYEQTMRLDRRALTYAGAQRIIRREHPGAIVTRVETIAYE